MFASLQACLLSNFLLNEEGKIMILKDCAPGFSWGEIEERAKQKPTNTVKLISLYFDKCRENVLSIDQKVNRLKKLCEDWSYEHYQEYLTIITELSDVFLELQYFAEFGKYLRDIHSY